MDLNSSNVVVLNNGHVGIIVDFNGKPSYIMTKSYCRKVSAYDENGKTKSDNYSISAVYDGSSIENGEDVFKSGFDVNNLPKIS